MFDLLIKGSVSMAYRISSEVCGDAAPEHFHFGGELCKMFGLLKGQSHKYTE